MKKILSFFIIIWLLIILWLHNSVMAFSVHNNMQMPQQNHSSCCHEKEDNSCKTQDCCIQSSDIIKISLSETNPQIKEPKNIDKIHFNQFLLENSFFIFENVRKIIPPNQDSIYKYKPYSLVWIIKLNI